ncbi:heparan-alpha-glucosaminide N-acetyltransferase-like [Bombus vosnesenskii]|uniref:Heparan-alpha-glucosaminide N-acetyltransferase-like n=1 Tax=Bombus vosnesenskii TaxID=207650 RepID=A0A6J3L1M9_9HYME|nr:heparan-alpha-glucosaminide N-acetyltransferase-like [Bombus vosnesenskii]XP_033358369.1 heparan-alpha-glucosaminide N-acetyltransferase-like [Bombus vosnesenskii]XP_033358371.1 heparan-alpha-glucosaminide N-acetyltransferase-like [Bombus vosnesenskii]
METMDEWICDQDTLGYDEACINLRTEDSNAWLYLLSADCALCPYTRIKQIVVNWTSSVTIDTIRSTSLRVLDAEDPNEFISAKNTSDVICELTPNLGQFGVYELSIVNRSCDIKVLNAPTYPYTELLVIFGVLLLVLFGLSGLKSLWHVCRKKYMKSQVDDGAMKQPAKRRVKAIDTVRGASTLLMIFVNDGSGGYRTLGHATWNGLLPGDLLFPCFIWIMGVCIPIAMSSQMKRMTPKRQILYGIVKRSILLFLIGLSLNTVSTGGQLETIRIFGVLQRFGITYFVVALLYFLLMSRRPSKIQSPMLREVQDFLLLLPQWCVMLVIVVVHCVITFCLNVPGCPTGYLGPGGLHDDAKYFDCVGGAAGYIDRVILKEAHLHHSATVYKSGPYDPEGILGTLTAAFQVFLGLHAGIIMMTYKDWKERVIRWLAWAAFFGCVGCVLHFTNLIPVNKKLWSLSFVFVTTSFSLAFLSACYLLVDVVKVWNGGPFRIPGMNGLLLYVGHMVCYQNFPFHWSIGSMESRALRLCEAIWGTGLWSIIAYVMHAKRNYISL